MENGKLIPEHNRFHLQFIKFSNQFCPEYVGKKGHDRVLVLV